MYLSFILSFVMQEGPEKISIFGQTTRTNAAVEAYNGYMGKIIQSHPNLFALVKKLREEEFAKSRELDLLFKSANTPNQRRFYRIRDEKIAKLSKLLKEDKMSVDVFLNGMVFDDNHVFDDLCAFDATSSPNLYDSDDDNETHEEQSLQTSTNVNGVISGATYVVCLVNAADVLLNCGHYKFCLSCYMRTKQVHEEKMVEFNLRFIDYQPKFVCPFCKTEITAHMHVPKIYH